MERELTDYLKDRKSVSVKIDVGYPASGGVYAIIQDETLYRAFGSMQ